MGTLFLVLGACLAVSFITSLWEGAIQAIPSSRVEVLRRTGEFRAVTLARLRERFDETIVALLALDTAANAGVVLAIVGLADAFADGLGLGSVLGAGGARWTVAIALILSAFLVVDLLPRSLGFRFAQPVALQSAPVIRQIVGILWPIVKLGQVVTRRVWRLEPEARPTADDVLALTSSSARAGNLEMREARWVSNALRLSELTVRQVMTPRSVVYALPAELPLAAVKARSQHWVHSRLPIYREKNPDEIVGLVLRRAVFDKLMQEDTAGVVEALARPVHSVPDSMTLDHLLEWFVTKRQHLAIVRDEFQAWVGVVTLEDVLESFLGAEIVDEKDKVVDMRELARKRAEESGRRVAPRPRP